MQKYNGERLLIDEIDVGMRTKTNGLHHADLKADTIVRNCPSQLLAVPNGILMSVLMQTNTGIDDYSSTSMPSQAIPGTMPSECSEVIEQCVYDTRFLPFEDSLRPPNCADIDRAGCDMLPPRQ